MCPKSIFSKSDSIIKLPSLSHLKYSNPSEKESINPGSVQMNIPNLDLNPINPLNGVCHFQDSSRWMLRSIQKTELPKKEINVISWGIQ